MAAKKAIVFAADGLHEQLQSGDTLEGAGGATAAGNIGEIQYKDAGGGLAASPRLKYEDYTDIPSNQSGCKIKITDGASLDGQIRTYHYAMEFTSSKAINFKSNANLSFIDGSYEGDFAELFLQSEGSSYFSTSKDFTFSIGTDLFISGGTVDIYSFNSPAVLRGWDSVANNTAGTGVSLKGGSGKGTEGSHVGIYTATYGGTSGSPTRAQAERFSFHGNKFGIGVTAPSALLHVLGTTEQLKLAYDANNSWGATIGSTGGMTWQGVGAGGAITISPTSGQNINLKPASTGKVTLGDGGTTNYIDVDAAGAIKLYGTAKITHHTQIAVTASLVQGSAIVQYGTSPVAGMLANANTDRFFFQSELLAGWDGADIFVEVDWLPTTALTNGRTVILELAYRSIAEGEDIDSFSDKTLTVTYTAPVAGLGAGVTVHSLFTLAYNDATAPLTVEDHIFFKVNRDATSDTFSGDCIITAFEYIWVANAMSRA